MAVALALYAVFALSLEHFQITGDSQVYFNLLRRAFGEHPDFAFAYQFGSDIWNLPFFAVGKGLAAIFGDTPRIFHVSFEELSIVAATQAAFILTLYLGWRLLRELELPAKPAVLFLTAFGSPLFYYVIFEPGMKHAADTLVWTASALVLLVLYKRGADRHALALGALLGVAVNIRYVNAAFLLAVVCALALYRVRAAAIALVSSVGVGLCIFALPALRGISYFQPNYFPKSAVRVLALGTSPAIGDTRNPLNGFDPLIPFHMLFSDLRGLYVWTPLTACATIGFILAIRSTRIDTRRRFLWTLLAGSVALLAAHITWAEWTGAYSFSMRFLTALFPLFLIGVAELRRRWTVPTYVLLTLCVAWSLMLAFVHFVGYDGASAGNTATDVARIYARAPDSFRIKVEHRASKRWRYIWALLHGDDPQHVHGL
jgi:hypothetical protein